MGRVLLLVMLVGVAYALPTRADTPPRYVERNGDELQLTRETEDRAVVWFLNSDVRQSPGGVTHLYHDGLEVAVRITVNYEEGTSERMTVRAPDGWWAYPEYLDLEDGTQGVIYLMRGEFQGM